MCGILGIIGDTDVFSQNCFEKGVNRGPEGSVVKQLSKDVLFGFHRLAINGLNTISNQPIVIDNIVLICNGEIVAEPS